MTNNTNGTSMEIRINGEKLDKVDSLKYLGAVITDQVSKLPEVLSIIAQTTAALAKLKTIWNDKHISLSSKISTVVYLRNPNIDSGHPKEIVGH